MVVVVPAKPLKAKPNVSFGESCSKLRIKSLNTDGAKWLTTVFYDSATSRELVLQVPKYFLFIPDLEASLP